MDSLNSSGRVNHKYFKTRFSVVRIKLKHVDKPWGSFDRYTLNEPSTVKILTIKPGATTSLQSHKRRREFWVALDKGIQIQIGDKEIPFRKGSSIIVEKGKRHRIRCDSKSDARILEISFGHFSENDIVRYDDEYGRVNSTASLKFLRSK